MIFAINPPLQEPGMEALSSGCHPFPMLLTTNGDNWIQEISFRRISSDQFRQLRLALGTFPKFGRNITVSFRKADEWRAQSLIQAVRDTRGESKIILEGDAGSGKSMALTSLAYELTRDHQSGQAFRKLQAAEKLKNAVPPFHRLSETGPPIHARAISPTLDAS
jgi:hypothetical protein